MRKWLVSALMISLLLLSGCSGKQNDPEEQFAAFRENLRTAESVDCRTVLHWNDGETLSDYIFAVSYDGEDCHITVEQPELIASVEAVVGPGGNLLGTGDLMLETGSWEDLTPLNTPAVLLRAMSYGYTELFWREDDYLAVRLQCTENRAAELWLGENGVPVCALLYCDGLAVADCRFEDWTLN